ncbi:hypothetical protein Ciccas_004891 [Cichlidogyrus casuarinus]|uniref:Uncharacterized protein n=1 Tax=Cichlidogyrus casuarinus TaxID=1844966 RepID=A0ABD2QB26_9PLAT
MARPPARPGAPAPARPGAPAATPATPVAQAPEETQEEEGEKGQDEEQLNLCREGLKDLHELLRDSLIPPPEMLWTSLNEEARISCSLRAYNDKMTKSLFFSIIFVICLRVVGAKPGPDPGALAGPGTLGGMGMGMGLVRMPGLEEPPAARAMWERRARMMRWKHEPLWMRPFNPYPHYYPVFHLQFYGLPSFKLRTPLETISFL